MITLVYLETIDAGLIAVNPEQVTMVAPHVYAPERHTKIWLADGTTWAINDHIESVVSDLTPAEEA